MYFFTFARRTLLATTLLCAALQGAPVLAKTLTTNNDAAPEINEQTQRQLNLFADVFQRVRSDYVEPVTDEKLIQAAINGMLTSLDPHSSYLTQNDFKDMRAQTKGEFGGLGLEVTLENGVVKVVSPIDDTPASKAGMQPGDLIIQIDKKPVMGLSLTEAVDKLRGAPRTRVKLSVVRNKGEPFDVELTRDIIKIISVKHRAIDNIGYIRITQFNERTEPGLRDAISSLRKQFGNKLGGYVLDLRNNPGGLLDQAISVSDTFLTKGDIVSTKGRHPDDEQKFSAQSGDKADDVPLVVLINGGSASASEIVAGAIQDNKRGIVLGTQSFGKGSVQTVLPIPGNGAIRLTTARYFTPSGHSIQAKGIKPDIEVQPAKLEEVKGGMNYAERDLKGALSNPEDPNAFDEKPESAPQPDIIPPTGKEKITKSGKADDPYDYQLARAVDLLRGLSLYQKDETPTP